MVGPPLHPVTMFGRVVPEPETGTDRGHADRSSHPFTQADQPDRGTGRIEIVVAKRASRRTPLTGDCAPPQAERASMPSEHSSVAARGTRTARMFADPSTGLTRLD